MILYFAYGSNMDTHQMRIRCNSEKLVGPAKIENFDIFFNRYSKNWGGGVADIIPTPGRDVYGLVYMVTQEDLELLDRYEGHPTVYKRTLMPVNVLGSLHTAWVYTVVDKGGHLYKPSLEYMNIILKAAKKYKFSEDYTTMLKSIPVAKE